MASPTTGTLEEVVQVLLEELNQPAILAGASTETISIIVEAATELDGVPPIRVLATEENLRLIRDSYPVASRAADLIDSEQLDLRVSTESLNSQLLITETEVAAIITAGERSTSLPTADESFVEAANEYYTNLWDDTPEFLLRTPPLSHVRDGLRETFGDEFADDFDAAYYSAQLLDESFDVVSLLLLLTAKYQELLYDISHWAEDIGIASKATFSRTKTELEELGLIDTEKVPIDVGRPRLRLKLAPEQLRSADPDDLLSEANKLA